MFKGMFGGGAEVDTVLHRAQTQPGGSVEGVVNITGGHTSRDVNFVELSLTARVEVETDDSEYDANVVYHRNRISGPFVLQERARHQIPFQMPIPWETPFNVLGGQRLHQVRIGVRTELDIARSVDKGDVDPIEIVALPSHEAILAGLARLGFRLKGSDLEKGHLRGSPLPFYQEVEFSPSPEFRGRVNELEVTFLTTPAGMEVVLEVDRRGLFGSSDRVNRFQVDHATADSQDWAAVMGDHLNRLLGQNLFGGFSGHAAPVLHQPAPQSPYGAPTAPGAPPPYQAAPPAHPGTPPGPPPAAPGAPPPYQAAPPAHPGTPPGPPPTAPGAPPPYQAAPPAHPGTPPGPPPAAPGAPPPYQDAPPPYQAAPPAHPGTPPGPPPAAPGAPPPYQAAPPPYQAAPPAHPGTPPGSPPAAPGAPPPYQAAPPAPSTPPTPPTPGAAVGAGSGINLAKGQNVAISQPGLTSVSVGLSWDVGGTPVDLDASAVLLNADGRAISDGHVVFYNNLSSPDGAVRHRGDSRGQGQGIDEEIQVDLASCAPEVARIAFVVSIHEGASFGQLNSAAISVADQRDGHQLARFDLAERGQETAMIFGELYRKGSEWSFRAVGQGYSGGFAAVLRDFGLNL